MNTTAYPPTLEAPRWRGGPPICNQENLPYFATLEELWRFHEERNLLGVGVKMVKGPWQCAYCGGYHYDSRSKPLPAWEPVDPRPGNPRPGKVFENCECVTPVSARPPK
jgi:hypothetical protein